MHMVFFFWKGTYKPHCHKYSYFADKPKPGKWKKRHDPMNTYCFREYNNSKGKYIPKNR